MCDQCLNQFVTLAFCDAGKSAVQNCDVGCGPGATGIAAAVRSDAFIQQIATATFPGGENAIACYYGGGASSTTKQLRCAALKRKGNTLMVQSPTTNLGQTKITIGNHLSASADLVMVGLQTQGSSNTLGAVVCWWGKSSRSPYTGDLCICQALTQPITKGTGATEKTTVEAVGSRFVLFQEPTSRSGYQRNTNYRGLSLASFPAVQGHKFLACYEGCSLLEPSRKGSHLLPGPDSGAL
jgi:hypothetical protein